MKIESIKFEDVSFAHEGQTQVFRNTSFEFPMNEILWVKSEEGAGKSSMMEILSGLQIPQSGQILMNGENICDLSFEEFLPYRLQIGYSFDYGGLLSNRTLFDNLMLPLLYHKIVGVQEAKERVEGLLKTFDLTRFANERPASVPGRIRKLTVLLRALVMHPQVLLLDDPSVGLGQSTTHHFVDYLQRLRSEGHVQHIFISSYDDKFMNLMSYQILHLNDGQIYYQKVDPEKRVIHL